MILKYAPPFFIISYSLCMRLCIMVTYCSMYMRYCRAKRGRSALTSPERSPTELGTDGFLREHCRSWTLILQRLTLGNVDTKDGRGGRQPSLIPPKRWNFCRRRWWTDGIIPEYGHQIAPSQYLEICKNEGRIFKMKKEEKIQEKQTQKKKKSADAAERLKRTAYEYD